jgi:integrase
MIIEAAKPGRDRILMKVLYCTAMRRSELVALKVEDLDFNTTDDFTHVIKRGKGGKQRTFYLDSKLLKELKIFIGNRTTGYVFRSR